MAGYFAYFTFKNSGTCLYFPFYQIGKLLFHYVCVSHFHELHLQAVLENAIGRIRRKSRKFENMEKLALDFTKYEYEQNILKAVKFFFVKKKSKVINKNETTKKERQMTNIKRSIYWQANRRVGRLDLLCYVLSSTNLT